MTTTLTYKNAYYNDCDNATEWGAEQRQNMGDADASIASDGDVITFTGVTDEVGVVEGFYHELTFSSQISQTTYPSLTIRFKTGSASATLQARVEVVFADDSLSSHVLGYSTDWKVSTVSPVSGTSTLMKAVRLYAIEDAAANANGTYYVYYDWLTFHVGTFTFPHDSNIDVSMLKNIPLLGVPGRKGNILQDLGINTPAIRVSIEVLEGERDNTTNKWRSASTEPDFSYLLKCFYADTWSYLACSRPLIRCQVMFAGIDYGTRGSEQKLYLDLYFLLYKLGTYSLFGDYSWIWGKA